MRLTVNAVSRMHNSILGILLSIIRCPRNGWVPFGTKWYCRCCVRISAHSGSQACCNFSLLWGRLSIVFATRPSLSHTCCVGLQSSWFSGSSILVAPFACHKWWIYWHDGVLKVCCKCCLATCSNIFSKCPHVLKHLGPVFYLLELS